MNRQHLQLMCSEFQLGSPEGEPTSIHGSRGGSLMRRVNAGNKSYAVKQLAPAIDVKNERIINKYDLSEEIAYRFAQNGVPAISAMKHAGKHLMVIENIGYLVYSWVDAKSLRVSEISENHAVMIVEILAKMHTMNLSVPEIEEPRFDIYSNERIVEAIDSLQLPIAKALKENQNVILSANDRYLEVIPTLKEATVVTHGDLDQGNVLWDKAGV